MFDDRHHPLRAVVIDDEPLARQRLLSALPTLGVILCGAANDAREGLDLIEREAPDVAFIDIQMPDMNGMELVSQLARSPKPPLVIFVTAFSKFAAHAYELHAVDFIKKPFSTRRLAEAVSRAVRMRAMADAEAIIADLQSVVEALRSGVKDEEEAEPDYDEEIWASCRAGFIKVSVTNVTFIEAERDYVKIHLADGRALMRRETLQSILQRLNPDHFVRVHRSAIVQLSAVEGLRREAGRAFSLTMVGGQSVPVSRSSSHAVRQALAYMGEAPASRARSGEEREGGRQG